ncbi:Rieske (2Fe-2S) protein [Rubinisphaera margarita]|uniref:Rieske (2Fe-2S) protein n=1 Tax=Rubinisphaera margarita TaxID=2909586 RepID=UPI001EE88131|nr:Rieske (2Fe-2S) protein [Rubinisphaera margarita]MCG6156129.1 Rieske (2Fe-2S) protein [Rubinisphaera margarita]
MAEKTRVCSVDELTDGAGKEFAVAGRVIAIFRIGDEVHAIDGLCPHAGGPIGTGTLRRGVVTCPWHGWQFDVRTGQHCLSSSIQTTVYDASVENGDVYITLPE